MLQQHGNTSFEEGEDDVESRDAERHAREIDSGGNLRRTGIKRHATLSGQPEGSVAAAREQAGEPIGVRPAP
jgi:hypothetical protein